METIDTIIDKLGGTVAASLVFGEKPATVSNWKDRGMPAAKLFFIKKKLAKKNIQISDKNLWQLTSAYKKEGK